MGTGILSHDWLGGYEYLLKRIGYNVRSGIVLPELNRPVAIPMRMVSMTKCVPRYVIETVFGLRPTVIATRIILVSGGKIKAIACKLYSNLKVIRSNITPFASIT